MKMDIFSNTLKVFPVFLAAKYAKQAGNMKLRKVSETPAIKPKMNVKSLIVIAIMTMIER